MEITYPFRLPDGFQNIAKNKKVLKKHLNRLIRDWKDISSWSTEDRQARLNQDPKFLNLLAEDATTMRIWLTGGPNLQDLMHSRMTRQEAYDAGIRTQSFYDSFQPLSNDSKQLKFQEFGELQAAVEAIKRLQRVLGPFKAGDHVIT